MYFHTTVVTWSHLIMSDNLSDEVLTGKKKNP